MENVFTFPDPAGRPLKEIDLLLQAVSAYKNLLEAEKAVYRDTARYHAITLPSHNELYRLKHTVGLRDNARKTLEFYNVKLETAK